MTGGNPDVMDFPGFLDVSYALLAEEHQRINPLRDMLSVTQELTPRTPGRETVKTSVAQNQQGMVAIKGMLSGVENSPIKKPRKS